MNNNRQQAQESKIQKAVKNYMKGVDGVLLEILYPEWLRNIWRRSEEQHATVGKVFQRASVIENLLLKCILAYMFGSFKSRKAELYQNRVLGNAEQYTVGGLVNIARSLKIVEKELDRHIGIVNKARKAYAHPEGKEVVDYKEFKESYNKAQLGLVIYLRDNDEWVKSRKQEFIEKIIDDLSPVDNKDFLLQAVIKRINNSE